jgi:hypothetical protein
MTRYKGRTSPKEIEKSFPAHHRNDRAVGRLR